MIFNRKFIPLVISSRKYFNDWEELGYHISLNHFYHPIPDLSSLDKNYWSQHSLLSGINTNLAFQSTLLDEFKYLFSEEFNSFPEYENEVNNPWEFYIQNQNFTSVDAEILFCIIRKFFPKNII